METLEKYRQIVKELLTDHASTNEPEIECQIICDTESDRYDFFLRFSSCLYQGKNCDSLN